MYIAAGSHMASDFHDLRPEQVPNAVTQSFPNVHFLANSSTVLRTVSSALPFHVVLRRVKLTSTTFETV